MAAKRPSKDATIEQVMRQVWRFYLAMILVLVAVTYLPAVSLWLPDLLLN